ncbi:MAG: hypothetical protein R2874_03400 [Desulfobacterales bacterium]
MEQQLEKIKLNLKEIPMKRPLGDVSVIFLSGEMFVRRDGLSRRYLTEILVKRGCHHLVPIAEWMIYSDYLVDKKLVYMSMTILEKLGFIIKESHGKT